MEILLLSIGKINSSWIKEGIDDYKKRLGKYIKFSAKSLPDVGKGKNLTQNLIKEEEGKLFLNETTNADHIVLLDERGEEMTSKGFSVWMEKMMQTGKKRLVFLIGGPYGFSDEIYQRQNSMIALSKMTFTHEMANLFFTEQIYRAFTIIRGEPYHHQ